MHILLSLCLIIPFVYRAAASSGSIELDELSFDKLTRKFDASLIKFDVAFPYGDKHDAFVALAKDAKDVEELLVAEVGVKDYGEKDNEELARKYGATKENFPVVKLLIKGNKDPIKFDDSKGFTTDALRRFVRENTGLYLSLPGCVREMDKLAIKFMKAPQENRKAILQIIEEGINNEYKDSKSAKIYKTIMDKVIEKGDDFLKLEHDRLNKILSGKISEEKKKELGIRLNILQTFQLFDMKNKEIKEEL